MEQITLSARTRENRGKGAARKLRRENRIPAVLYGPDTEPVVLTVEYVDLQRILKQTTSENILLGLQIDSDSGSAKRTVMLKELQVDPIKDTVLHADFHEISMDQELTVNISIRLVGTPVGVTNGGMLQHIRRELSIACLPGKIVEYIEYDVSGLDIGDSIHVRDLILPADIRSLDEDHLTVAVLAAPTVEEEEEIEEEEIEEEGAEETGAEAEETSEEESKD